MTDRSACLVLTICRDDGLVRRALSTAGRTATVEPINPDFVRRLPLANGLVVDDPVHARVARATGFNGAIVILDAARTPDEEASSRMQAIHFAGRNAGAEALGTALAEAIPLAADGTPVPADPSVARARQLLAAGEIALVLRHQFNNPLTALLAEVQLLQLDTKDAETKAAAGRMLALVHRLAEVTRSLEGVRERSTEL